MPRDARAYLADILDSSMRSRRFLTLVMGLFASIVVILACTGVYGIVSHGVAWRRHEIGIRVAIGASRLDVARLVFRQTLRIASFGAPLGVLLSITFASIGRNWVYGLSPLDPVVIAGSTAFVLLIALLATGLPARRATRVDPVDALRSE